MIHAQLPRQGPMLREHNGVAVLPSAATIPPPRPTAGLHRRHLRLQLCQEHAGVGHDRQMNRRFHLADFSRVNVHHDLAGAARQAVMGVGGHSHVQPRADHQQQVAVLQGKVGAARRERPRPAKTQRMRVRDQIEAEPGGQHRNLQGFHNFQEGLLRAGGANAVARQDDWAFDPVEGGDEFGHLLVKLVPGSHRVRFWGWDEAGQGVGINHRCLHVQRNVNPHRSAPPLTRQIDGLLQMVANAAGFLDGDGILGE